MFVSSSIAEEPRIVDDQFDYHGQDIAADDEDIYRGDPPAPRTISIASSSRSSSSEYLRTRKRLGAISAVVEQAISRWARGRSSSSSSSSDSVVTIPQSQRRRQRQSMSNLQSLQSERDITARIKAREESRLSPRQFALYLPTPRRSQNEGATDGDEPVLIHEQGIPFTTSLPLILDRLDGIMNKTIKARHNHRHRTQKDRDPISVSSLPHHHYMFSDNPMTPSRLTEALRGSRKGKRGLGITAKSHPRHDHDRYIWWLDVSSPTWQDMRAIAELLHLHPLTLEDILHQDPREKLELFDRLGYYFIVFRAIESSKTLQRIQEKAGDAETHTLNDGMLGHSLVYLVVLWDGICTFHFTDISEHVDRVKTRLFRPDRSIRMSPDWIAHGILDSIVDSFFPYLEEVGIEILKMERLIFSEANKGDASSPTANVDPQGELPSPQCDDVILDEKTGQIREPIKRVFSFYRPILGLKYLRQFRHFMTVVLSSLSLTRDSTSISTAVTLRRVAKTRRQVTSLTRLLATKSEVVAQITKRLLTQNSSMLGNGKNKADDIDVAMYMGDVQDHILSLQYSLSHYERVLSQSHPTYLSQLSVNVAQIKSGSDKAVTVLTIISITILCLQIPIGVLSLNVRMPTNRHSIDGPYNIFFFVIALCILITIAFLSLVRWWWNKAKRRHAAALE